MLSKTAILNNRLRNFELQEKGYTKFPLLNEGDIERIKDFYHQIRGRHNITGDFFHTTMNTSCYDIINEVNNFLRPILEKQLNHHTNTCSLTIAGFLAKSPGKNTEVTIHQDWSFVDESKYRAYNLWVSLENTNLLNGNMQFIPKSHSFTQSLRVSPDIPGYYDSYKDDISHYLIDVPTKAGECVLFDQSILHASRKNLSKRERVACVTCVYPKKADLLHHFIPDKEDYSTIEQYQISNKSMLHLKKDQRPPFAEYIGTISYKHPDIDATTFKQYFNRVVPFGTRLKNKVTNILLKKMSRYVKEH